MQPNLERSMLPNGDIFASGRSCTFLAFCFHSLCKKEAKIANSMQSINIYMC